MEYEHLGNIATIRTGKYDANHATPNGAYKFYTCAFEQFKSPTYSFEGEAIVLPGNGANVGEVFFNNGEKFEAYQRTYVVENIKAYPKYVFMYFKSFWKASLKNTQYGSATNYIRLDNLTRFRIPLPPINEQIRIAEILSQAESLIAQRKESIRLLDEFLKSTFLEMFGNPGTNSKEFPIGKIRDIVTEVKYGTSKPAEDNGAYPYLRMNNITFEGYMDYSNLKYINLEISEKEKYVVKKGDILFNRTNSKELVGKTGVFDSEEEMAIAGYLIRVRTNEKANPWYVWGYLNSKHGKQTLAGMCKSIVGMANINAQELQEIKILLPPVTLQKRYANVVEKVESLKIKFTQSLIELENMYGVLSQNAFEGELPFLHSTSNRLKKHLIT